LLRFKQVEMLITSLYTSKFVSLEQFYRFNRNSEISKTTTHEFRRVSGTQIIQTKRTHCYCKVKFTL